MELPVVESRASDLSEQRRSESRVWSSQYWVIEGIEGLKPELQVDTLSDIRIFDQG